MSKSPRTRHSGKAREPITIDLEAVRSDDDTVETKPSSPQVSAQSTRKKATSVQSKKPAPTTPDDISEGESSRQTQSSDQPEISEAMQSESALKTDIPAAQTSSKRGIDPFLGGLIGGVAVVALAAALQWGGILSFLSEPQQGSDAALLQQDIQALKTQIASIETTPQLDPQPLINQSLTEPLQSIEQLRHDLSALQKQVALIDISKLNQELDEISKQRSDIDKQIAELSPTANSIDTSLVAELAPRLDNVERELNTLRNNDQATTEEALNIAQQLAQSANLKSEELAGQLAAMTTRLDQLDTQIAKADEAPKLALIVAASALKSALERGVPFRAELETYIALAGSNSEIQTLLPIADKGIPSLSDLSNEATAVASQIANLDQISDPSAGVVDRLMSSARSLITVRPIGDVAGTQPAEIAARMEAAVKAGNIDAALNELASLPEDAQAVASALAGRLRAHQTAIRLVDNTLSQSLKPL